MRRLLGVGQASLPQRPDHARPADRVVPRMI